MNAEITAEQLISDNRERLIFFINRYVRDLAAAEEIAIDALAEFLVSRKWDGTASVRTYLFTIGRSRAIDYLRRRNRRRARETELDERSAVAEEEAVFSDIIADERRRILSAAMAKLPEDMRAAVHLVYFEDMTYAEAARILRKNVKQVDNLLYRAKAELRRIIGEEGRLLI